jgi:putative DNA primase/helicase
LATRYHSIRCMSVRLVARHRQDLHYSHPWKKWFVWNGSRWIIDEIGAASQRAKETVRAIHHEVAGASDRDEAERISRHAFASESDARIKALLSLATSEPGIPVPVKDYGAGRPTPLLDKDPWLLNCPNGTLDLRTGELREHRREDLITKMTSVRYSSDAKAPLFEKVLNRVVPDPELRTFIQRVTGMALTGDVSEQKLFFLYGTGANGKSTFVNAVLEVSGSYGIQATRDLLVIKRDQHPTELTDLFGRRLVASVEAEDGRRLAESLVKMLTGGENIRARRMREDFWEFPPTHKLFLVANHKPIVRGTDHAIWRRIKLIPFDVTLPEDEQDKTLPDKLEAEYPGILAWAVKGCQDWQKHGLAEPKAVTDATAAYRAEMDMIADFIEECCITGEDLWCKFGDFYNRYTKWCEESGEKPLPKLGFGNKLTERGILSVPGTGNVAGRSGIDIFRGGRGAKNFVTPDDPTDPDEESPLINSKGDQVNYEPTTKSSEAFQDDTASVEHTYNKASDRYQSYSTGDAEKPPKVLQTVLLLTMRVIVVIPKCI